jgi:hypothetical protein
MGTIKSVQFYFAGLNVRVLYNIMSFIFSSEIELYRFDGTHLTDIGNDIYLNNLQGALETLITSPNTKSFPVANI